MPHPTTTIRIGPAVDLAQGVGQADGTAPVVLELEPGRYPLDATVSLPADVQLRSMEIQGG